MQRPESEAGSHFEERVGLLLAFLGQLGWGLGVLFWRMMFSLSPGERSRTQMTP